MSERANMTLFFMAGSVLVSSSCPKAGMIRLAWPSFCRHILPRLTTARERSRREGTNRHLTA
jgi:hypothetical protein